MQNSFVEDLYNSRGGRGRGWGGRARARGLGRGGAPGLGRGRGGAKTYRDERSELELAKQTTAVDAAIKVNNAKKGEGVGARYGFIPGASPTVGLGGSGPIGQGANRGFVPHAGRGRGAPPPSVHIPPEFCAPAIPGPVGIPFNGVRQDPPHLTPPVPAQAVPFAQVTIPSPINTQGAPNGGRGRGSRGGWFKGANGRQDDEIQPNNGDEASDGNRGGRGWRGGFTGRGRFTPRGGFQLRGGFHGRGRGTVEESDRGGRGQFQYPGRGGRGRGGTGPWGDRAQANGERRPSREPVVDNLPPARGMRENVVGPAIAELTAPHVAVVDKPTKPENLQCISSYTWKNGRNPTLIVPGSPREWLDRALPFKVDFDSGVRMFHEDAFYMAAESTLIPLFRAVDAMTAPSENADAIEWATVDFVTDRNNLRKLLRWIREPGPTLVSSPTSETSPISPTSDGRESSDTVAEWDPRKDFRIDLQLGGEKSVLMQRWAARAREMIAPPKGGCRANFEREHTAAAPGCEDAGGHYRIVQYNIGGLKMVVRFEVDACVATEAEAKRDGPPHSQQPENNARAAAVATSDDPISNIVTSGGAKSPARQSFTTKDEKALWASGNPADDWGIPEEPPTPQLSPSDEPKVNQSETEEVDSDKEAEMWAGGGHDSWGMPSESPHLSKGKGKGKGKADTRGRAPSPEDLGWDIPDDGAAWGVVTDAAQDEETLEPNGELTVVRSGTLLPQSSILELATRSIRYADRTSNEDTFLQIFLTQTPTHLVAIHQNGNFEKVVRQELESAEFTSIAEMEGIQKSVAQFVELLKEIQRLVKEHGTSGRLSLVCEKGKLGLFGLGGEEGRLSDGELERFKASTQTQA